MKWLLGLLLAALGCGAAAQSVALQGMMGSRALLIINGAPPKMLAPGETHQGVKLLSASGDEAVVEVEGKRLALRVGAAPASVGGGAAGSRSNRIVLPVDSGGHFMAQGAINGRSARFLVDTGATAVSLSVPDAQRLGLDYRSGRPVMMQTANGATQGWVIRLPSVRVGDVEVYDVEAVVTPQPMGMILLGNTFLNRFQMTRDNAQMVLERRY